MTEKRISKKTLHTKMGKEPRRRLRIRWIDIIRKDVHFKWN
jgi:hypothetical protein